jgi:hypothetical protein
MTKRQKLPRYWMDVNGNIWICKKQTRTKPLTSAEIENINDMLDAYAERGGDQLH